MFETEEVFVMCYQFLRHDFSFFFFTCIFFHPVNMYGVNQKASLTVLSEQHGNNLNDLD